MQFPLLGRWEDAETGVVLIERLFVAETFGQRLRGLQFARPLEQDSGLMLRDCRSVHTMWMRFAIDLIFLCKDLQILETHMGVKPWRVVVPKAKGVAHIVEVTSGSLSKWCEGMRTRIMPSAGSILSASGAQPKLESGSPLPLKARGRGEPKELNTSHT